MLKRAALPALLFVVLAISGCKKSEGTKIKNFFGSSPTVTEVSITKTRQHFQCDTETDLCCAPPQPCDCCCLPDIVNSVTADLDLFTASAKVIDADGASNILVVLLRFFDPPKGTGGSVAEISLEMFDTGPAAVGHTQESPPVNVLSGDQIAGDGTFTRRFYFGTTTLATPGPCIESTDVAAHQGIYTVYSTTRGVDPSKTLDFQFVIQAIDLAGNATNSSETVIPVQGEFADSILGASRPCGDPIPGQPGGCFPGTP